MEKQLTTEQSLDLIARMIASARRNFNETGGEMFLIWGYSTIAIAVVVTALFLFTGEHWVFWLWWCLPVIGGVLTWRHFSRYQKPVVTHIDRAVWAIWRVQGAVTMACTAFDSIPSALTRAPGLDILFTIALLISTGTTITGAVINFRPLVYGGGAGVALSFLLFAFSGTIWQTLIFAGIFLVVQIIPGHLLNAACKREAAGGEADESNRGVAKQ